MSVRLRSLLAALVALALLLAACGDDDDSAGVDPETTEDTEASDDTDDTEADDEADDEAIDVCALIDLAEVSALTGETFTKAEQTEADTCQVTDDAEAALLQLSVRQVDEGETEASFVEDARTACDPGTEITDVDLSYAAAGFACEISGEVALLVAEDGAAGLLIGHPSDPAVTTAQIVGALNQIMQGLVSA